MAFNDAIGIDNMSLTMPRQ